MFTIQNQSVYSIFLFVFYYFIFSLISILTKLVMVTNIPVVQILCLQMGVVFLVLFPFILMRRNEKLEFSWVNGIARAFFWSIGTYLFFSSLKSVPLNFATALSFLTPLFTGFFGILFFKEKWNFYYIVAFILGVVGMLMMIQPQSYHLQIEILMIILACLCWSFTDVIIKKNAQTSDHMLMTFFFCSVIFFILCPYSLLYWVSMTYFQWFLIIVIGLLFLFNMVLLSYVYQISSFMIIQPFSFFNLIFTSIFSYLIFNEAMTLAIFIGGAVICIGGGFVIYGQHRNDV